VKPIYGLRVQDTKREFPSKNVALVHSLALTLPHSMWPPIAGMDAPKLALFPVPQARRSTSFYSGADAEAARAQARFPEPCLVIITVPGSRPSNRRKRRARR
jgi:hypothetical protein